MNKYSKQKSNERNKKVQPNKLNGSVYCAGPKINMMKHKRTTWKTKQNVNCYDREIFYKNAILSTTIGVRNKNILWPIRESNGRQNAVTQVICLLLIWLFFITFLPRYSIPREWKNYAMQYKKVQKSSWNKLYSSSSFTKQSCSKMALYRGIRTESRWNKKLISQSTPDWSASLRPSLVSCSLNTQRRFCSCLFFLWAYGFAGVSGYNTATVSKSL